MSNSLSLLKLWLHSKKSLLEKREELKRAEESHQAVCDRLGGELAPKEFKFGETITVRFSMEELGGEREGILYIRKEYSGVNNQENQYLISWKN